MLGTTIFTTIIYIAVASHKCSHDPSQCLPQCEVNNCTTCASMDPDICILCQNGFLLLQDATCAQSFCQDDVHCLNCSAYCLQCETGFVLVEGTDVCQTCEAVYCQQCLVGSQYKCMACSIGFTLISDTGQCQKKCEPDFYAFQNSCIKCPQSCAVCDSQQCRGCYSHFYWDDNAKDCQPCLPYCQQCNQISECIKCHQGYYLSNFVCLPKPLEIDGFVWSKQKNFTVYQCPLGCEECQINGSCLMRSCSDGYFWQNQSCFPCSKQCLQCLSQEVCFSCQLGTSLQDAECIPCSIPACLMCQSAPNICDVCIEGYYSSIDGECLACSQSCLKCNNTTCLVCDSGMVPLNAHCISCMYNCMVCDPLNITKCLSCGEGFYMTPNSSCEVCPKNYCSTCNELGCQACIRGYRLSTKGKCIPLCEYPCLTCLENSPYTCLQKFETSTSASQFVPRGFYIQANDTKTIYKCELSNNCTACTIKQDKQVCARCDKGYYLTNARDPSCERCPTQCLICHSAEQCQICAQGYFMTKLYGNDTGNCQPCSKDKFCLSCLTSATQCTSCMPGYSLFGIKCISNEYLKIQLHFALDFAAFPTTSVSIKRKLAEIISNQSNNKWSADQIFGLLFFLDARSGSTILDLALSIPSNSEPAEMLASVEDGLSSGDFPYTFLSTPKIQIESFNTSAISQQNEGLVGIIIAVVVTGVILIVIIWFLIQRRKNIPQFVVRSKQKFSSDSETSDKNVQHPIEQI